MKNNRNKASATTTLILTTILVVTIIIASAPAANAIDIDTYAYISVTPNPVGVNQQVQVTMWLNLIVPVPVSTGGAPFQGYQLTITKPDGSTETRGPFSADPISNAYLPYTPTELGTYYFQFSFPGQTFANGNYYKPSESVNQPLTVQQQEIQPLPENPLPTGYWERPINYENRLWYSISGSWLMGSSANGPGAGRFNPYTRAPNTGHILWTKELTFGGLVGGQFGDKDYYTGIQYENKFTPPLILNGRLYINEFSQVTGGTTMPGFDCIDIRTGETLWTSDGKGNGEPVNVQLQGFGNTWVTLNPGYPALAVGELFDYESPNQHGIIPYLWSIGGVAGTTRYDFYDAFTGRWILSLDNAMTGTNTIGPNGELMVYILNGAANWLARWNSTKAIPLPAQNGTDVWQWRPPVGKTLDWSAGIEYNVTVTDMAGSQSISKISDGKILAQSVVTNVYPYAVTRIGYDTETGNQLWYKNLTNPADRPILGAVAEGVYTEYIKETLQWYGYSMDTGDQVWGPSQMEVPPWGIYASGTGDMTAAAYGKLFTTSYSGWLHAYDIKTGERIWNYSTGNSGVETPYGTYPIWSGTTVADNKVFIGTGEHSPDTPLYKGEQLHAVNIDSGAKVWSIKGWYTNPAVADGYLVAFNYGDNRIYCFGKGQTEMTLTASSAGTSSTLIQGKITDQSPAQKGSAVVPDQYMSQWMEYLQMQQPLPSLQGGVGVPVTLYATTQDGTTTSIATINADCEGNFMYQWTPPNAGIYEITASFDGTESYWSSYATTAAMIGTSSGPIVTPTPTSTPTSESLALGLPAGAWILGIIVIIILVALIALVLRKR
jgi:hypothetical protein